MGNKMSRPRVLMIIGAMKCGTTSLFKYLSGHPEIIPCKVKEPEFFCEKQKHRVQVNNYFDLWPKISQNKFHMEASTGYTKFPDEINIPQKIYNYGLRPKLIYIVRDPIKRIESYKTHRLNRIGSTKDKYQNQIEGSKYFTQLQLFREFFPKQDILVLEFDELIQEPDKTVKQVCQFLQIDSNYQAKDYKAENCASSYPSLIQFIIKHYYNSGLRHRIPSSLLNTAKHILNKLFSQKVIQQKLNRAEKESILNELALDMQQLKEEYGINTDKWHFS